MSPAGHHLASSLLQPGSTTPLLQLGAALLAGLGGSLHCLGMCGPLQLAFAAADGRTRPTGSRHRTGWRAALGMTPYHLGRLATYGLLGVIAGLVGERLRAGSALLQWQRPASLAMGALVISAGLLLLWLDRGRTRPLLSTCGLPRLAGDPRWRALLLPRPLSRFLLGALMGFLPCGLVYAMVLIAVTLPNPWLAWSVMVAFGLGTVPALSAVIFAGRRLAPRIRRHGVAAAAFVLLVTGTWMGVRAWLGAG